MSSFPVSNVARMSGSHTMTARTLWQNQTTRRGISSHSERAGFEEIADMPVAWLGLALVVVVAVPAWWLARRARAPKHERPRETAPGHSNQGARGSAPRARSAPSGAQPTDALSAVEVFRRLNELAFGVERLGLPALGAYDAIAPEILATLDSVATDPRFAPRRPLLLPQLLRAMRDDEVTRSDLARIIGRDPALAGSLLKL